MAKKPFHFTDRDPNVKCRTCGRPIKRNLIFRKQSKPELCFKHHMQYKMIAQNIRKRQR